MKQTLRNQKTVIPAWFRDARFGLFIHWGIYSVLGHGEQPLFREFRNHSDYEKLADRFLAEKYDPVEWTAVARRAQMKYMVLTTKHHDGYCLWDTATTDYNSVKRGPGRDLVAEYVRACRQAGLRVGLYFSLPDWRHRGFTLGPDRDRKAFRDFIEMSWQQMEELVSNYGKIDLLWFDGAKFPTASQWRSTALVRMLRRHQPGLLINDRLPKPRHGGDWGYATPEQRLGTASAIIWESCITSTRKFWGYHVCHEDPSMWYTDREVITMLVACITRGGNLLWNVGPYASGEFPARFKRQTRMVGEWIRRNRPAIDGTEPAYFEFAYGGMTARKANQLYLFFLYWPGPEYSLPGFKEKLIRARLVDGGRRVRAVQEPHRVILKGLPTKAPDLCTVIELTFARPPTAHPWAENRLHNYPMPGLEQWLKT